MFMNTQVLNLPIASTSPIISAIKKIEFNKKNIVHYKNIHFLWEFSDDDETISGSVDVSAVYWLMAGRAKNWSWLTTQKIAG